ncbi:MAG: DnaA ATPase domain-containing protein, partial [Candidatus Angelobacter sp.]
MSVTTATLTATANPWLRILGALEKKISRHSYDTWLKPTRYSHENGAVIFVRVPTPEFRHIGEKFGDLIQEALEGMALAFEDVKFITAEEDPTAPPLRSDGGFAPVSVPGNPASHTRQQRFDWDSAAQLNSRYTFDGFVIGAGNQFAHAASRAVAERPSRAYNP